MLLNSPPKDSATFGVRPTRLVRSQVGAARGGTATTEATDASAATVAPASTGTAVESTVVKSTTFVSEATDVCADRAVTVAWGGYAMCALSVVFGALLGALAFLFIGPPNACGDRVESKRAHVGPGFATPFERTTPVCQRCKNHWSSSLRVRSPRRYDVRYAFALGAAVLAVGAAALFVLRRLAGGATTASGASRATSIFASLVGMLVISTSTLFNGAGQSALAFLGEMTVSHGGRVDTRVGRSLKRTVPALKRPSWSVKRPVPALPRPPWVLEANGPGFCHLLRENDARTPQK